MVILGGGRFLVSEVPLYVSAVSHSILGCPMMLLPKTRRRHEDSRRPPSTLEAQAQEASHSFAL